MAKSLFTTNQLMKVAGITRKELQLMQADGLTPVISKSHGGRNGELGISHEWHAMQVYAASVCKMFKDRGSNRYAYDAAYWISQQSKEFLEHEFRQGKTILLLGAGQRGYGKLIRPSKPIPKHLNPAILLQRVEKTLAAWVNCIHKDCRATDNYCGDCGTDLRNVATVRK